MQKLDMVAHIYNFEDGENQWQAELQLASQPIEPINELQVQWSLHAYACMYRHFSFISEKQNWDWRDWLSDSNFNTREILE